MSARSAPVRHHAALERVVLFDLRLTCRTGLHIGAGKNAELAGSDLPVLRDASGRPLIPGSSLRGVLRSGAEALVAAVGLPASLVEPSPPGGCLPQELVDGWGSMGLVERLFGKAAAPGETFSYGSRLQISDLLTPADVAIELRDAVAIDRETRTVSGSAKYDLEVVPAGTAFTGRVRFKNPEDFEVGLIAQVLSMLDAGLLLLGGKTARGLGWMEAQSGEPVELDARAILAGKLSAGQPTVFGPVDQRLERFLTALRELASEPQGAADAKPRRVKGN